MSTRPDLSGAFAKPAVAAAHDTATRDTPRATPPPRAPRAASTPTAGDPTPETIRNVPAYLPHSLKDRVRQVTRRRDITLTELVLDAFEAHGSDWNSLTTTTQTSGPPRRARRRGKDTTQVQLRLDAAQERWLQEQVNTGHAPSRSALVTAVLTRYLE